MLRLPMLRTRLDSALRRQFCAAALTIAVLTPAVTAQQAETGRKSLRLLARFPVPGEPSKATDIRWASDNTVFLARVVHGVEEVSLDPSLTRRRSLVPDRRTLQRFWTFDQLAVSPEYLVVASTSFDFAWRRMERGRDGTVRFERKGIGLTADVDVAGDRLLLLGMSRDEFPYAPNGEVAWLGTLNANLADFRPVLYDPAGPPAPNLEKCGTFAFGAVRFLLDGSFVVVPGFQPGAYLYTAAGRLAHTWTDQEIGLDSDCSEMSREQSGLFRVDPEARFAWINKRRVLDDIVPLPEGPGLLVRSMGADRKIHWELRVLRRAGIDTYEVPVSGNRLADRLRGDFRNGKLVLLLRDQLPHPKTLRSSGELFLLEIPRD